MRSLRLALRALRREWRSGELAVLWLSLCIAVAALTGGGLPGRSHWPCGDPAGERDSRRGSARRVRSARFRAIEQDRGARNSASTSARLTTMLSAIFHGNTNQLADVRAVTAGYPLRGTLTVADRAVRRRAAPRARFPPPARPGRTRAWPPRSASGVGGELEVGAAHAARHAHPDLPPRSELDLRRVRPGAADQRRGSGRQPA